jgi:hypothetical protein
MNSAPQPHVRRLRVPAYFILGLAFIFPLVELGANLSPWHPGLLTWRFAFAGLLSSTIVVPILVLLFIYAFGLSAGDRKVVVACGIIAAVIALLLVGSAGSFALDALQMKRRVSATKAAQFDTATVLAMIKFTLYAIATVVMSASIFRTLRTARVVPGEKEVRQGSLLVGVKADKRLSSQAAPEDQEGVAAPSEAPPAAEPPAPRVSRSADRAPSVGTIPPPPPRRPE